MLDLLDLVLVLGACHSALSGRCFLVWDALAEINNLFGNPGRVVKKLRVRKIKTFEQH